MQISTEELNHVEMIAIKGRVDSVEAVRLEEVLESARRRGRYKLVIDMSQLEYMSSAGFRALATAQKTSRRGNRGELVLTQVPPGVFAALELVGFTEYFKIIDPPASAVEYAENLPTGVSSPSTQ
ncbi:MAG: STAS domain-containing protein [Chloroflexota bacterium]|nr:STAS domain-containing protein [Chloroflexota bacterium]